MAQIFKITDSDWFHPMIVLLVVILLLILNFWIFKKIKSTTSNKNITKGAISFLLVLIGLLAFILVLPIGSYRKEILAFLGIVFSAGIALSATTVLGNLLAGIMNDSIKRFRNGDLIKIGDFHGRVTRKGLFHTEIQLEDSNFLTIPNLYIASNPFKITRETDTVISTSVSLGYDIPRNKVEAALNDAAIETGLSDPYVYITSLGDFSVVYKIHGFLKESSKYFSTCSLLNAKVMDKLHDEKIEIVSPSFIYQRSLDEKKFIPKQVVKDTKQTEGKLPEDLIFDEAIQSEKLEKKKDALKELDKRQKALKEKLRTVQDDNEVEQINTRIAKNIEIKERIEKSIKEQIEKNEESEK